MATLPATTSGLTPAQPQPSNNLATGFAGLSIFRQIGILVGLAASIAIGFAVVLWSQEPDYYPLLSNTNRVDTVQAADLLQANNIPFKLDQSSGALMVASDRLHEARMKLAAIGVADQPNVGFELLDKDQGLGTSQFMENISFRRGLEGELARTISSLHSIKAARVHLAMPKSSVFVRDQRKSSASVFVDMMSGRSLGDEQVQAIINLVASSVPEMDPGAVTIVDQKGRLLSSKGQDESSAMAAHQFEYTRKLEETLSTLVQRILEPVVGLDKFKTQVSANVDFTAVEQTAETYNPDLPALRSEQTLDEQRGNGAAAAGGVPGALANQPPGAAAVPELAAAVAGAAPAAATDSNGNRRQQATRNFELDRTISYTRNQVGRIQRLSVAVVVDNFAVEGADPQAWPQEDLDQLTELVKGAIGYDAARGDSVTVINAAFAPIVIEPITEEETPIWESPLFQKYTKQGLAAVFVLILVFAVIRPIMKSLSTTGDREQQLVMAAAAAQSAAEAGEAGGVAGAAGGNVATMNPATGATAAEPQTPFMLPGPGASYDEQLAAVRTMVAEDPERVAQVMKQWVASNED